MLVFVEGGKPEKNPGSKARINNKLNPHMARIEPGPHWWEVSTLTTVPSLLPIKDSTIKKYATMNNLTPNSHKILRVLFTYTVVSMWPWSKRNETTNSPKQIFIQILIWGPLIKG